MKRKCEECGKLFIGKRSYHPYKFCSILCRNRANARKQKGFWDWVDKSGDCWEWLASRTKRYGMYQGRQAHRVAYEFLKGPVPKGLELDHLCRNRYCVNPDHLEAVPHQVNVQRGGLAEANRKRSKTKS